MNRRFYNRFKPYGVSVFATGLAVIITLWLQPLLTPTLSAFFFIAIVVSTWYGGLKPGLLATLLSTLAINYFFIPPLFAFTIASLSDVVRQGAFTLAALLINLLSSDLRRSKRQVEQLDRELFEVTQKSAEQLRQALTAARMGMWYWNILTGEITWSPEHEQLFGLAPGTFDSRYETFDRRLHPDDRDALNVAVNRAIQERNIYQHEYRVVWPDGSIHWIEGRGQAFYDEMGQAVQMTGTVMDISDRKLATSQLYEVNRALRTLSDCNQALVRATDEAELLNNICEILVTVGGYRLVWVGFAEDDTAKSVRPVAQSGYEAGYLESLNITWADTERGRGPTGTAIRTGEPCIAQNLLDDPNFAPWRDQAIRRGYASSIALPLIGDDKPLGAISIYAAEPDAFDAAEVKLLIELAQDLAYGIVALRTQKARTLAEKALQKSEEQLSLALKAADMGMWNVNLVTNEVTWSSDHERLFGLELGTFDGRFETFYACLHPDDRDALTQAANRAIAERTDYHHEFRVVWKDGSIHWIEAKGKAFYNEAGQAVRMTGTVMDISDAYRQATQRKLAEESILRSEERYRSLVTASFQIVWTTDEFGNGTSLSPAWFDLIGKSWDEFQPWGWVDYIHPDDRDRTIQAWTNAVASRTMYETEYRLRAKDGNYRDFLVRGVPVLNLDGSVREWVGTCSDITARKKAETALQKAKDELELRVQQRTAELSRANELLQWEQEALRESEERFRSAFDYASIGMALVGLDGSWLQVNSSLCEIVGYEEPELLSLTFQAITHPDDLETDLNYVQQLLKGEIRSYEMEKRYFHKQGHEVWVLLSVSLMRDRNHQPLYFIAQIQDISDRKFAQEERTKLIDILEATSDIVATASVDKQVRYLNNAARRLFGFGLNEDLTNFSIPDAHPNWAFEIVRDVGIPAAVKSGVWLGETAFLSHEGREIPISQLIIAHKRADGSVGLISTVARDITQQKQTEATLREAERRWRYLLENVHLVVVGLDNSGKVEFANAFFLELTGYTQAEVLGKDWFETFLPLQAQQQVYTAFQEVLEYEFHPHYTNAILTKSGEERIIAWNNTQLRNLQGEVIGTMSIGEDITERHAVEKMKNEFISIVSHELRTPLTSIRGSLGMLATGALNNHPLRMQRMIEIAAIDTERLVRLVNDILDLERLDSGKVTLVKECCDAATLMEQSAEAMRSLALKEKITLSVSSVPALVWASSDHIIQTLTNLLSNAIKFSPANSTITLSAEPLCDRVLFQVKDQGRGIPADKLETIFGRFQQVDASDSRKQGGTGLGLAICHSIITQHGGRIWVESVLGEGSTFYFTLPVSPEQPSSFAGGSQTV